MPFHVVVHIFLVSTSTWRLVGSAWFPSSIIVIQLTNKLGRFDSQRSNGWVCNVVLLKHVFGGHTPTQLQQAVVSKLCFLLILKSVTIETEVLKYAVGLEWFSLAT